MNSCIPSPWVTPPQLRTNMAALMNKHINSPRPFACNPTGAWSRSGVQFTHSVTFTYSLTQSRCNHFCCLNLNSLALYIEMVYESCEIFVFSLCMLYVIVSLRNIPTELNMEML